MGTATLERLEYVEDVLKSRKGGIISGKELMEGMGLKPSAFYTFMQQAKKVYPTKIKSSTGIGKVRGYWWEDNDAPILISRPAKEETPEPMPEPTIFDKVEEEKPEVIPVDRYDDRHTEEGYSDPTAYLAMRTMDNDIVRRGEVWNYNNSNGSVERVVVLASKGNSISCVPIYMSLDEMHEKAIAKADAVKIARKEAYILCSKISSRPFKYFGEKVGEFSKEEFEVVKAYVALYLGVDGIKTIEKEVRVEVPVEVEKIVEKEVPVEVVKEVPVEVVKEVRVEVPVEVEKIVEKEVPRDYTKDVNERIAKAVESAVYKAKVEIYERVIDKLLAK